MTLLLAACGSGAGEQARVVSVPPTSVATTAPLSVPTAIPVPAPRSAPLPELTSTPPPTPTVAPAPTAPTLDPAPSPTTASDTAPPPDATTATGAEIIETPTPVPTPTAEEPEPEADVSTPVAATPTAVVVASGEPPLECWDRDVQLARAFVESIDDLSFEGGRVYCTGAAANGVSAARSYRHSSGLVVQRHADFIFNDAGTGYIPYSGSLHFCMNGQPASAPVRADTLLALFVVIDNEAQRELAQGAVGPAAFTASGSRC